MSLKVVIFEDDLEVAELLKEMMERHDFEVVLSYSLKDSNWQDANVVLGDYRNNLVRFDAVKKECENRGIPLIAISGAETNFRPQLLKPFLAEELQACILQAMIQSQKSGPQKKEGFFKSLFKK